MGSVSLVIVRAVTCSFVQQQLPKTKYDEPGSILNSNDTNYFVIIEVIVQKAPS